MKGISQRIRKDKGKKKFTLTFWADYLFFHIIIRHPNYINLSVPENIYERFKYLIPLN